MADSLTSGLVEVTSFDEIADYFPVHDVSAGLLRKVLPRYLGDWRSDGLTWTRTGNHTFYLTGDVTDRYRKGARVRYKDGGAYEYGVIASSSYAAGATTVNLIPNTSYTMAAATITDSYLSYSNNPEGFPHWFNFTSTPSRSGTAYTNLPTVNVARWSAVGRQIQVQLKVTMHGTPGGTGYQLYTLPATPQYDAVAGGQNGSSVYLMYAFLATDGYLKAWKYEGTAEATASAIYFYTGSYEF